MNSYRWAISSLDEPKGLLDAVSAVIRLRVTQQGVALPLQQA